MSVNSSRHCSMVTSHSVTVPVRHHTRNCVVTRAVLLRCTVRYGNTAYSRIYTVLDRIYGKIRYGVRYGPNFESLSQKIKMGGAAAALPQGLEFALHLFCWALSCCCRG